MARQPKNHTSDKTNKLGKTAITSNPKNDELLESLQRLQAEFINYKRRSEEDKIKALALGKEQAMKALVPVIDNLDRALAHEPEDIKENPWVKGVAGIAKQLETELKTLGLEKFGEIGDVFDAQYHDAVSMVDGDGDTEVIVGVAQKGYLLDGRVIRHAIVQVGKR
ncbi:MAG: nucleotide exchange factor GrpE [Patescibacteria group bacterium]|jgi:molecular chaperone GrpE|nr:nucleotide exchange factor GrpE [Patescibacteria group bacterium]